MYRLILDTETAGNVNCRKSLRVYDLGYKIVDGDFNTVCARSFIVRDTFFNKELMTSAYYAEKVPTYWEDIKAGTREIHSMATVRRIFCEDVANYKVKQVWAYNAGFDRAATNTACAVYSNGFVREFLPAGVVWCDIWACATDLVCNTKKYFDFCINNGFVSDAGNVKTSAEVVYRYLTNTPAFVESHTALEDVEIETFILWHCLKKRRKMNKEIAANPWRVPQKKFKEYVNSLI